METSDKMPMPRVLLRGVAGSRAYGFAHADSDYDYLGVGAFPTDMLMSVFGVPVAWMTEHRATQGGDDFTLHEVGKYLQLAMAANPSASELLWLREYDTMDEWGAKLVSLRESLLSQRAKSAYLGYTQRQALQAEKNGSGSKGEKFGRHLYRLVHTSVHLWGTGQLVPDVVNKEDAFEYGRLASQGEVDLSDLMAYQEEQLSKPTPLAAEPDLDAVNDFLVSFRRSN